MAISARVGPRPRKRVNFFGGAGVAARTLDACVMQTVASLSARTAVVQTRLGSRRVATSRTVRRAATPMAAAKSFYDLSAKDIDGNDVSFEKFKGKVVLVTNVACK